MEQEETAGRVLAARHATALTPDPIRSLVNYAESPRIDDWTLRSALVRLAQPEPVRAGAVLELVRRCDAALHPLARALEAHTVGTDADLTIPDLVTAGTDASETPAWPTDRARPDARITDLARIARARPEALAPVIDGYEAASSSPLTAEERDALPVLVNVLELDELGELLAAWAAAGARGSAPIERLDAICAVVFESLDEIGVPREQPLTARDLSSGRPRR